MLGKKIAMVLILCSLFTLSFSQVTVEIKNVTSTTLDIYMTNAAGCSYCTDPSFDNKNGCESYGSTDGGITYNAVWTFDTSIDAANCAGTCSDSSSPEELCTSKGSCSDATYTSIGEASCEAAGICSLSVHKTQAACETASGTWTAKTAGTWTANTWTHAAKNGNYFSGEVGGFQFELKGATTSAASGGSAAALDATSGKSFAVTAGGTTTLGYSTTGDAIAASSTSALLTTITYADDAADTSKGICFGIDTGSSGKNALSDKHGGYIHTIWGVCSCDVGVADACGECEGNNPTNCYATNSASVCTAANQCEADFCDCSGTCGGSSLIDQCDTCDDNPQNDCKEDCANVWGGTSLIDCTNSCVEMAAKSPDEDNDGYCDDVDACPGSPANVTVNASGCTQTQLSISQLGEAIPTTFSIAQNFPNPFNPTTNIAFDVAHMDNISLIIYDLTGKEVVTLASGAYAPGSYNVEWNAIDNNGEAIVSGMYIYRYISSEKAITRKMLYLK